jgi:hypothetical protein
MAWAWETVNGYLTGWLNDDRLLLSVSFLIRLSRVYSFSQERFRGPFESLEGRNHKELRSHTKLDRNSIRRMPRAADLECFQSPLYLCSLAFQLRQIGQGAMFADSP